MSKQILRKGLLIITLLGLGSFLLSPKPALAANPATINFQGKVVNADGTNVTSGTSFIFRIYDTASPTTTGTCASNASCWWEETDTLTITNGVFQVELGAGCAFSSACSSSHSGINFNTNNALYLTLKFNGDAAGFMSPTIHLTSVPYAFNADNLGGISAANFVQLAQGLQTDSSTTNASIAINKTNASGSPDILLLQKSGKNVLEVNNSGTVLIGQAGASGLDGTLTFNNSAGANTVSFSLQANPGSSYTLLLPTTGPSTSQCLQSDPSTASQLIFSSCSAGGGDNGSVNSTAVTDFNLLNVAASGTVTGTTWTLTTASNPDDITLAITNASASQAGAVTNGAQTFGGVKTFQDIVILQPATSLTAGQNALSQTLTNASTSGGTVEGYDQNITVSNTTSASTTNGFNISLADSTSLGNTNRGINISLSGTNTSQNQLGADISVNNGFGIRAVATGTTAGSGLSCGGSTLGSIAVGVCADATSSTFSTGVYARSNGQGTGGFGPGIQAIYASNTANVTSSQTAIGVEGISSGTGTSGVSIGVLGSAKSGSGSSAYGGYFTFANTNATTSGAALFASNNASAVNILQLQDASSSPVDVLTVADGGALTITPFTNNAGTIIRQTQGLTSSGNVFDVQTQNGTSHFVQITNAAANEGAVTIQSVGATRDLTLDSSSGTLKLGSSTTTLQKAASALTLDISNGASSSTLTIANSGGAGNVTLALDSGGSFAVGASTGTTASACSGNQVITGTLVGGIVVSGSCVAPSASTTLPQAYTSGSAGDQVILLSSTNDSLIVRNPSSSGSDSGTYALMVDQLATGSIGGLDVQSAGTGNLLRVRDTTATAADVFAIADGGAATFKSQTNSTTAFQIQNAAGTSLLNIDTTSAINIITNPGFELDGDGASPTGWAKLNGAETTFLTDKTQTSHDGTENLKVVTAAATANQGAKYVYQFLPNTTYTFSIWAFSTDASWSTFDLGTSVNGSTATCVSAQTLAPTQAMQQFSCSFTTGATTTGSDYVFARNSSTTSHTFYLDSANLQVLTSNATNAVGNGSFENGNSNGWRVKITGGAGSPSIGVSSANAYYGSSSLKVITGTAGDNGASFDYPFTPSTKYSLSFWARHATTSVATLNFGEQDVYNNTNATNDTDCLSAQTLNTTWTYYSCSFTTGSSLTVPTSFYIKTTGATNNTFFVDGVTLVQAAGSIVFNNAPNTSNIAVNSITNQVTLNGNNTGEITPWQTNGNALPDLRGYHSSVVANGYVYVIGGTTDGSAYQSTVYYAKLNADGSTGAWATNANALPALLGEHSSVVANGYVYVIGGYDGSTRQSTVYYAKLNADGSTGAWATNANALPGLRADHSSVVANGYVYVIGGYNGSYQSTVYYAKLNADGSTGAWATNANALPGPRRFHSSVVANGYVYVIGGTNAGTYSSTVYYAKLNADGSTGAWATNANALPDLRGYHSSVVANGYVYVIGGLNGSVRQSTVYYAKLNADGSTGAWATNANALPGLRNDHSSIVANGYVYVIGGFNSSNFQSTVYYASTSRVLVGGSLDLVGLGGQNLADGGDFSQGSNGGTLTAGNTTIVGSLQVAGQANFTSNTGIGGSLTVNGGATVRGANGSTSIMSLQNAGFVNIVNVSTVNLIANSNFETGTTNVDNGVDGWSKKLGTETSIKLQTTAPQFGSQSMELVTTTATGEGAKYLMPSLTPSTQYTLSFYAKVSASSFATLTFGRSDTGVVGGDTSCVTTGSISTTYARFNCTFTTGATMGASGTPYLYITKGTDASVRTIYIDGVQLETGATMTSYRNGDIAYNGNLVVNNVSNANNITIVSGTTSSSYTITLPTAVATANNYCLVSSSAGILSWVACGAGSTATVTLVPEFVGAVLTGDGSSNVGTMTSDYCAGSSRFGSGLNTGVCTVSTEEHNYYTWTSTGANDYEVFVRWQTPSDFASFSSASFNAWKTASGDDVKMNVYNNSGSTCAAQSMTNTTGSWQSTSITMTSCTPSPGNVLTIDIHMAVASSGNFARIGEISLTYNRN